MDLIKELMDNKRAFGLCTPREQECFKKVGKGNCIALIGGYWQQAEQGAPFDDDFTYRIKPDYQPEPEPQVEKCEVKPNEGGEICYWRKDGIWMLLHEALSDPDFIVALDENGKPMSLRGYVGDYIEGKPAPVPKYVVFARRPK